MRITSADKLMEVLWDNNAGRCPGLYLTAIDRNGKRVKVFLSVDSWSRDTVIVHRKNFMLKSRIWKTSAANFVKQCKPKV